MAKGGFRGGYGGMGGMNQANMMKQAPPRRSSDLKMQEELEASRCEATAGGGVVKAVVSGKHELTGLTIDPEAVDPEDVEMLQDLIIAAVNEALRKVDSASSGNMAKLTGMKGLPF